MPSNAIRNLSNPPSTAKRAATVRVHGVTLPEALVLAAERAQASAALARLVKLTGAHRDPMYVKSLAAFLGTRESILTLSAWAPDNAYAKVLEPLAMALWSVPDLADSLREVDPDEMVAKRFHGALEHQYLAGMAAVPTPIAKRQLVQFVQRLRVLCMVRALEAQEVAGAIREEALDVVCTTLRMACDTANDPHLKWPEAIAVDLSGFRDFTDAVAANCRREAANRSWKPGARNFFRRAQIVATGGPWVATQEERLAIEDEDRLIPETIFSNLSPPAFARLADATEGATSVELGSSVPGITKVISQIVEPGQTLAQSARAGEGLILESVEDMQFLRQGWHHLTEQEEATLVAMIRQLLGAEHLVDRVGASIAIVAVITCRSMEAATRVSTNVRATLDWDFEVATGKLRRAAPRFHRRWRAGQADVQNWIAPVAEEWAIRIDDRAAGALRAVPGKDAAKSLGDLWRRVSPDLSIDEWFAEQLKREPELVRLHGKITAHALQVSTFERAPNHSLARLIGSQEERSGLPAACAYGAYRAPVVRDALQGVTFASLYTLSDPFHRSELNCCGSELDVSLNLVHDAVKSLIERTNAAASDPLRWVEHHNLLTSLAVLSLLASTGARPVKSPMESLAWLDLKRLIAYVEDKVSGPTRGSRICVLSKISGEILGQRYLPHLADLVAALKESVPRFAAEIERTLNGVPDARLPLFFFLRTAPSLDWIEIDETQLQAQSGIEWPLPWNLFRHIQATELLRRGISQEIVDALLAHADRDAESHGNYSLRIPRDDLEAARPVVDALQEECGFALPDASSLPAEMFPRRPAEPSLNASRAFGRAARTTARKKSHQDARERALADIHLAIGSRPPESLSDDDWHAVALKMLFQDSHVPHPSASLRHEVFEEFIAKLWRSRRKLPRLRKRFALAPEGASIFDEGFVGAAERLERMSAEFESAVAGIGNRKVGPRLAGVLAALDLVLTGKVAHKKALYAITCLRGSVQLVKFQSRFFFEWTYGEMWRDGRPTFRVRVRDRTARWIALAMSGGQQLKEMPSISRDFDTAFSELGATRAMKDLLDIAANARDQLNAYELPGTDAAYLGGRLMFSALPHVDWVRIQTGKALAEQPDDSQSVEPVPIVGEYPPTIARRGNSASTKTLESSAEDCAALFEVIRQLISKDDVAPEAISGGISRALAKSPFRPGDVPFVLANFISYLSKRKPAKGTSDRLRIPTIRRSWYALSGPMGELAHGLNLVEMDEEEVTELYADLTAWWEQHFNEEIEGEDPAAEKGAPKRLTHEERVIDASRRTLAKLREFHEYAQPAFGVDDPDWSEISAGETGAIGRPGFVQIAEYLRGFEWIQGDRSAVDLPDDDLAAGFAWLCCGRFGLRLGESVGMYRRDWIDAGGALVVLVQPNAMRPLKTRSSRRKVPLLEPLSPAEQAIVDEVLRRWPNTHGVNADGPLLPGLDRGSFRLVRARVAERLRETVKAVTCNSLATPHMLRHSFACRVFATLRGLPMGAIDQAEAAVTRHMRLLLLGHEGLDRRATWSVARLLGHVGPAMAARCYLHGIDLWIATPEFAERWEAGGIAAKALVDLDRQPRNPSYGAPQARPGGLVRAADSQLTCLLLFLRLIAQGYRDDAAMATSRLTREVRLSFEGLLHIAERSDPENSTTDLVDHALMKSMSLMRWDELVGMSLVAGAISAPTSESESLPVVGKRRQLVLFEESHFAALADFIRKLALTHHDICLVESPGLDSLVVGWIQSTHLQAYLRPARNFGKSFQPDATQTGSPPHPVRHRVVALPPPIVGRLATSQMLLILWYAWLAARQPLVRSAELSTAHE